MDKQTILVTGATGRQGGAVALHLLQRGFTVHALVRDPNKPAAQAPQQAGALPVQGDLNDRASLDRALQGVTGVFSVQGWKDGLDAEVRQGKSLADAAKAAGVRHFVYSSVGSAERKTGIPHFDSKFEIEEHIRAIGLPHTILRPVAFLYNYNLQREMVEQGTIFGPLSPDRKLQEGSEEDYAAMVAQVFERPADFLGRAIEAASVDMTMAEIASGFSAVTGKTVAYQQVPFEAFGAQAGHEVALMYRWFQDVGYGADFAQLKRDFGAPASFESYSGEHDRAPTASASPVKS